MSLSIAPSADGLSAALQIGGVTKATLDSSGNLTAAGKVNQAAQSMVRLNTANGYGSTNTKIRRFTNTVTNQGTDITYADSATLGASFTINANGVYAISYSDNFNAGTNFAITINGTAPTLVLSSVSVSEILIATTTSGANYSSVLSWNGYLTSGAVIRAHCDGNPSGVNTNHGQFTITRVA